MTEQSMRSRVTETVACHTNAARKTIDAAPAVALKWRPLPRPRKGALARDRWLRTRLTAAEQTRLYAEAQARGVDVSEWVRHKLGIEKAVWLWVQTRRGWQEARDLGERYKLVESGEEKAWEPTTKYAWWSDSNPPTAEIRQPIAREIRVAKRPKSKPSA